MPELLETCGQKTLSIQLHLGDLISVDTVGLYALQRLRQAGAELLEVPSYIKLKLDALSERSSSHHS